MTATAGAPPSKQTMALLAALSELDETDRIRYMRAYLEYVLDLAQANEDEYCCFLAECAMLAANNVQDIRIEHLELRFDALVNPPPKPWGEVFTEVAIALALQASILVAWEVAAAGFISMLAWAAVRKNTFSAAASVMAARGAKANFEGKILYWMDERDRLGTIASGKINVHNRRGAWFVHQSGKDFPLHPEYVTAMTPPDITGATNVTLNKEYAQTVEQQILLSQHMVEQNQMDVERALAAYESALSDARVAADMSKKGWGDTWSDTLNGAWGGVIVGTTMTALQGAVSVLDGGSQTGAAGSGAVSEPFLSSEVVSRYLDWVSSERMRAAETYANMRMMLRATSDKNLLEGDEFLKLLLMLGTEQLQGWRDMRIYRTASRPAIAKGMEAAIWYEYLSANGILLPPEKVSWRSAASHQANEVVGTYYILSAGKESPRTLGDPAVFVMPRRDGSMPTDTPPPMYAHDALLYKHADRMPELLVGTLFMRYAQSYYAVAENAAKLLPFVYKADAYANIKIPPDDNFWGYPDPQAMRRIAEMRFIVIRYFTDVVGTSDGASSGVRNLIPTGTDPAFVSALEALGFTTEAADSSYGYWISGQMECVDSSDAQARADADTSAMESAEQYFRQLSDTVGSGLTGPLALQIQEAMFGHDLTDLNQDIQAYQLMSSGVFELGATGDTRTLQDLEIEIRSEKDRVSDGYQALLDAAGDDKQRQQTIEQRYWPAVNAAQGWEPGSDWVWYGPSESLPEDPLGESPP